jgi:hypothetical protein
MDGSKDTANQGVMDGSKDTANKGELVMYTYYFLCAPICFNRYIVYSFINVWTLVLEGKKDSIGGITLRPRVPKAKKNQVVMQLRPRLPKAVPVVAHPMAKAEGDGNNDNVLDAK